MEKDPKNLFIGILIGIVLILLYVYIPYEIQGRREIKHRQEVIDSLKRDRYQLPKHKSDISEDSSYKFEWGNEYYKPYLDTVVKGIYLKELALLVILFFIDFYCKICIYNI